MSVISAFFTIHIDTYLGIASKHTAGACGAGPESSHSTAAGSCGHVLSRVDGDVSVIEDTLGAR